MISPPFLEAALREGAVMVAQFSAKNGFSLNLSWPVLEGVPSVQAENASLMDAFMEMERRIIDFQDEHEELVR